MQSVGLPFLASWQNFYTITGTAAATLTGLMFVVTTLLAGIRTRMSTVQAGVSAFSTPTIVHFCAVLLIVGILSAPWEAFSNAGLLLGLTGLGMVVYLIIVIQRMRCIPDYQTPLKDWLWYGALPLMAYLIMIASALVLPTNPALALYIIAAVMFVLLFIGIHNAWDLVNYLAAVRYQPEGEKQD